MKKNHGFTIIELIAVMVIASILAAIAIPSFQDFVKDNRISAHTNELITDFHFARTESIKRNRRVTVCKSANGATCDVADNLNWTQGWITFVDNGPANGVFDAGETILRTHSGAFADVQIGPRGADGTIRYYVSYIPRGIVQQAGGGTQTGYMRVCDDRGLGTLRVILISQTGRVRSTPPPDSAAISGTCPPTP